MKKTILTGVFLWAAAQPVAAQIWDTSGNGLLRGAYYFRQIVYAVGDSAGDLGDAAALYGTINFNGSGSYSISGNYVQFTSGAPPQPATLNGTYSISASGFGFFTNPVVTGASIYGMVSNGIIVGSSTESGLNDLFVAVQIGASPATASTFQGSYNIAYFNSAGIASSGGVAYTYDAMLQLTSNGSGSIGTVSISGNIGTGTFSLNEPGVKYFASGGAEVLTFPTAQNNAVNGQEYLYISSDGNFVVGGSPQGYDMFVGVRSGSSGSSFGGSYYRAGIDQNNANLANGYGLMDSFYESFSALSSGSIIGHQRILSPLTASNAFNVTYAGSYPAGSNGNYTDSTTSTQYISGSGGTIVIGYGLGAFLGISVAVQAPGFTPSGSVYIYPNGVVNAASSAPFTAGVVPGELITIYGQNLAGGTAQASAPFPTTLGKVQVLINGIAAPVYSVTSTQVSAQVPFGISTAVAQIQVVNNGTTSNAVTEFVYKTAPGVFTITPGGLGDGAILHADYSPVTAKSPAVAGETVLVYVTGLGTVFPVVADGAAASLTTLSQTTATITAFVGGMSATVAFAGLAPGYAGLYQVNLQIPTGLTAGDNTLDIAGPDSYTTEALIPIG